MFKKSIFIAVTLAATLGALSTANADVAGRHRCNFVQDWKCPLSIPMPPRGHVVVSPPPVISQPPVDVGPPARPTVVVDPGPSIPEPPYRPHRPRPVIVIDGDDDYGITCGQGRKIVRHSGYRRVRVIDCSGNRYTYSATRHGEEFGVVVNRRGRIVDVFGAP